jgi:hypothetical protein
MSIQSGDGVLEILDGTLKVSRLDIQDITGLDVGINTIARNMVLLRDDQTAATVPGGGVSATSGISRDTGNEETVFTGGYVYWPIKVPNAWTMQFKVLGALIFSFSNTSEPTSSVASDNHGGYKMVFDSVNSRFSFYYQGTEIEATRTDYDPLTLTRVLINYEYGGISVVLDDDLVMNYALTHGEDAYTGEYVGFAGSDGAKVKDIKLTNGDKWQYTADSNASSIAYLNGNVGIGTSSPQKTLDVRGDARVTGNLFVTGSTFVVDQQNLTVKDKIIELGGDNTEASSNVGMILTTGTTGSNVAIGYRGEESELIIGFTSNIATESELTPKAGASLTTKIYGTLETTGTTTASAFVGDGSGLTNVTLAQVAGYGNTTSETIQFNGAVTSLITSGNVGIGTTTALVDLAIGDANTGLNQEGEDELGIYTGGQERLRVDASGNVGIGVASPEQTLHIAGTQYINGLPQGASVTHDGAKLLVTGQTTSTTPESLITITRPANSGTNVASKAALKLSRWSADTLTSSRSKLDFALSSGAYSNEVIPLTLQANQKIGIANTSPQHTLSVGTHMYVDSEGLTVSNNAYVTNKLTVQGFRIVANEYNGLQAVTDASNETSNTIIISNVTQSTSQTTGALTVSGGVGIGKDLYASKIVAGADLVADTDTLYVDSSTHRVGIGMVSPTYKLNVLTDTNYDGISLRDSTRELLKIAKGDNGAYINMFESSVSKVNIATSGVSWLNGGNVGIGTADPDLDLHVMGAIMTQNNGTITPQIQFKSGSNNTNGWLVRANISDTYAGDFTIDRQDNSVTPSKFVIKNDGNVGIGTVSPVTKCQIAGKTTISENISTQNASRVYDADLSVVSEIGYDQSGTADIDIGATTSYIGNYTTTYRYKLYTDVVARIAKFKIASVSGPSGTYNGYGTVTDRITLLSSGNVGIGTTTPHAKLHVNGANNLDASSASRTFFYYGNSSGLSSDTNTWGNASIYATHSIVSSSYLASIAGTIGASDTRIKKNIVDADDAECLEVLRLLKPKKYQYKDEINRGTEPVWGFIAQEVRETLPHATQLRQDVLPNIYELANVSSSNVITFTNFNTSNLESNATTLIRTKGIDGQDHDIHLVEVIDEHSIRVEEDLTEWIGSVDETGNVIAEITTTTITPEEYEGVEDTSGYVANISGYQNANVVISVEEYNALEDTAGYEEIIDNYTKTVTTYPGTQLFVYGQEVDDFVFIKKEAIWTVATAALQEVDRQLQAEKAKVATLESQLTSVLARLDALESV